MRKGVCNCGSGWFPIIIEGFKWISHTYGQENQTHVQCYLWIMTIGYVIVSERMWHTSQNYTFLWGQTPIFHLLMISTPIIHYPLRAHAVLFAIINFQIPLFYLVLSLAVSFLFFNGLNCCNHKALRGILDATISLL